MTGRDHEAGVASLTTFAALVGCTSGPILGDGRRPDVLRWDPSRSLLFVGEAKDAEGPSDCEARTRLAGYLAWIRAHFSDGYRSATLTMNISHAADVAGWRDALLGLVRDADLPPPVVRCEAVDDTTNMIVAWWSRCVDDAETAEPAEGRPQA